MYRYDEIRAVHLEVTTKCNARCPMCLRTICGGEVNPQLPLVEVTLDEAKVIFPKDFIKQLHRFYMCGNYGDPMVAMDTLPIFRYLKSIHSDITLSMFTNGSGRSKEWWTELAQLTDLVHFSIDGLEDTNHLYRRGTRFEKVIESAETFIQAGGKAIWDYIVFAHNEHQVEEARALSKKMGFSQFVIKKTGRFFSNQKLSRKHQQVVQKPNGNVDYYLKEPCNEQYKNKALQKETMLVKKYGSLKNYLDYTPIACKAVNEKSLYISAEGLVFPCCWIGNQLYPWYYKPQSSEVWKKLLGLGAEGKQVLDAKRHSLREVVENLFFQKTIPRSWEEKSLESGKLKVCAKTCGSEFDLFKQQFQ